MLDKAKAFVEEKKGEWDHIQWDQLLNDLQSQGVKLTDEAKSRFGEILEGLKGVYSEAAKTEGVAKTLTEVKDQVVTFVQANSSGWDQAAWDSFVQNIQKKGVELSGEGQKYLGNIAEAAKKIVEDQLENNQGSASSAKSSASSSTTA